MIAGRSNAEVTQKKRKKTRKKRGKIMNQKSQSIAFEKAPFLIGARRSPEARKRRDRLENYLI